MSEFTMPALVQTDSESELEAEPVVAMTTAENIQELHNGGYQAQAMKMANAESISIEEFDDEYGGFTEYVFADDSIFGIAKSGAINVR